MVELVDLLAAQAELLRDPEQDLLPLLVWQREQVAPDLEGARRCGIAEVLFDPTGPGASGAAGAGRRVARSYAELAAALERASSLSS